MPLQLERKGEAVGVVEEFGFGHRLLSKVVGRMHLDEGGVNVASKKL